MARSASRTRRALARAPLAALALALPARALDKDAGRVTPRELGAQVGQVAAQVRNAQDNLSLVESQYADRVEPSAEELAKKRYSDGEIQYLLGDWRTASVLFYDLVSDRDFQRSEHYPDALYFLADALYQQGNDIGARLYLRQLLALESHQHYREGLQRYLDVAGRLNDFEGIDGYIARARTLAGGQLPEDLAYVYGKWLFRRDDLTLEDRLSRADEVFGPLAASPRCPYRLQSAYFLAVGQLERGNDAEAIRRFTQVAEDRGGTTERELKVKELANLSLGRLLYETGQYDRAIDRYQEVPRESEYFPDSLYEIAWAKVKKGDFQAASNAVELLELVAPDSTLKPDADVLHAHLALKLHQYQDATDTYEGVIRTYGPVRDRLDALLNVNQDPVAYFDNLLARNDKGLNVNALLPPLAVKWATTQQEVAHAVRMVNDLEGGRHGLGESSTIARNILKALDERGLQAFPALQEGYTRADAVESGLAQSEQALVRIEGYLVEDVQTEAERRELAALRARVAALKARFDSLPKNERELEARKQRLQGRVDALDKEAFRLSYELQSMSAMLTAVQKWVEDTREERHNSKEDEQAFGERVEREGRSVEALQGELTALRSALQEERAKATSAVGGDDALRAQYVALLEREQALHARAEARLPPEARAVAERAREVRERITALRERVEAAKGRIQAQVAHNRDVIREKVVHEQALLAEDSKEADGVGVSARQLVGRIAFDSFKRVRQQFYDLVLKADVGMVDVAFTRKQDQTAQIQRLSQQKDRELRSLDDEFKEVLKDVD